MKLLSLACACVSLNLSSVALAHIVHDHEEDSAIFIRCTLSSVNNGEVTQQLLPPLILNFEAVPEEVQTLAHINGITFGFSVPHSVTEPIIALHVTSKAGKSIVARDLRGKNGQLVYSTVDQKGSPLVLNCTIGTMVSK
ncbi:hypothetical protein [Bdellovibrio bacteriovorus]|uniref:hypothetical protein n=1 Tax=Bdellovibrio TaxID=958 RepID=UPI0035A85B18